MKVPWTARRSNQSILKETNADGRTDGEAEVPVLWPPYVKSQLARKELDIGKDLKARGEEGSRR